MPIISHKLAHALLCPPFDYHRPMSRMGATSQKVHSPRKRQQEIPQGGGLDRRSEAGTRRRSATMGIPQTPELRLRGRIRYRKQESGTAARATGASVATLLLRTAPRTVDVNTRPNHDTYYRVQVVEGSKMRCFSSWFLLLCFWTHYVPQESGEDSCEASI